MVGMALSTFVEIPVHALLDLEIVVLGERAKVEGEVLYARSPGADGTYSYGIRFTKRPPRDIGLISEHGLTWSTPRLLSRAANRIGPFGIAIRRLRRLPRSSRTTPGWPGTAA